MRRIVMTLILVCAFVICLGVSYSATVQAGPGPPCCFGFCGCQLIWMDGVMSGGQCDLNRCGSVCNGPGINCR